MTNETFHVPGFYRTVAKAWGMGAIAFAASLGCLLWPRGPGALVAAIDCPGGNAPVDVVAWDGGLALLAFSGSRQYELHFFETRPFARTAVLTIPVEAGSRYQAMEGHGDFLLAQFNREPQGGDNTVQPPAAYLFDVETGGLVQEIKDWDQNFCGVAGVSVSGFWTLSFDTQPEQTSFRLLAPADGEEIAKFRHDAMWGGSNGWFAVEPASFAAGDGWMALDNHPTSILFYDTQGRPLGECRLNDSRGAVWLAAGPTSNTAYVLTAQGDAELGVGEVDPETGDYREIADLRPYVKNPPTSLSPIRMHYSSSLLEQATKGDIKLFDANGDSMLVVFRYKGLEGFWRLYLGGGALAGEERPMLVSASRGSVKRLRLPDANAFFGPLEHALMLATQTPWTEGVIRAGENGASFREEIASVAGGNCYLVTNQWGHKPKPVVLVYRGY